jgi:hypothetical protein
MSWIDVIGYLAALAVLCSFCMTTIVPLRIVAIVSCGAPGPLMADFVAKVVFHC